MPPVGFEPKISAGELITRPEESYRLWCVVVCDLETSRIGAPYIYDISNLRVNPFKVFFHSWEAVVLISNREVVVTQYPNTIFG